MKLKKGKISDARKRILEASLTLFSENGFFATTTRKIAQAADVNEVTLFRHFSSKRDLLQEILLMVRQHGFTSDWIKDLDLDLDPVEALRSSIKKIIETIEGHVRIFRILMYAMLDGVEGFQEKYVQEHVTKVYEFLTKVLNKLKQHGKLLTDQDPETLAMALLSQVIGTVQFRALFEDHPLKDVDKTQICDSIVNLFIKQT